MAELTISQVAQQTGLRPSTLRHYEKIGLLLAPRRICGRRRYERSVLDRLALIIFAKKAGFRLREIRVLRSRNLTGRLLQQGWRQMAEEKRKSLELIIARTRKAKAGLEALSQCGCRDLDECGNRIMRSYEEKWCKP